MVTKGLLPPADLVSSLKSTQDLEGVFHDLQDRVSRYGGCYHYDADRVRNLGFLERGILQKLPWKANLGGIDIPVTCGVLPVFLPDDLRDSLTRLGELLPKLLEAEATLLERHGDILPRLAGDPECRLEATLGMPSGAPKGMRVDFLLRRGDDRLFVIDMNLLPGGLYFSGVLAQAWMEIYRGPSTGFSDLDYYRAQDWWERWRHGGNGTSGPSHDLPWISAKGGHGLFAEFQRISQAFGSSVGGFSSPGEIPKSARNVLRGFRLRSLGESELRHVQGLAQNGTSFSPPFSLFLENHQWFYFLRRHEAELAALMGRSNAQWLLDLMPETYLVRREGDGLSAVSARHGGATFAVDEKTIRGFVVKRGGSTGGRGVILVEKNGGQRARRSAISLLEDPDHGDEFVLQDFIKPSKYPSWGFLSPDRMEWRNLPIKLAAYFFDGHFLGGVAVQRPSHKVYGSLQSVNVPVFWSKIS